MPSGQPRNLKYTVHGDAHKLEETNAFEGATVNGGNRNGNGNGNGNGKGSSKLPATIVVQLKMEEIYGWYGP